MTTQTERDMYQLTRQLERARANLIDACGRGRVGYYEQAYTVACHRLASARLAADASQIAAAILGPGNERSK